MTNFGWRLIEQTCVFMSTITSNVTFGCYIECYYWNKNTNCSIRCHLKSVNENYKTLHKTCVSYSDYSGVAFNICFGQST